MAFVQVERTKSKLRLALTGPTNSGKTYSALLVAYGITKDWSKIAFIDTERGRAKFYANRTDLPYPTGQFLYAPIEPPYTPDKLTDLVKEAQKIVGENGVLIVDSLSHFWSYRGGVLDIKEELSKQRGKNSYTAWNEAGQLQNEMIDILLSSPCHVIVTMRSKMDYVLETNAEGKAQPKKVGLAPVQRDDTEYEFDITLMLDSDHKPTIIKDTTFLGVKGEAIDALTPDLGEQLVKWLDQGVDPKEFEEQNRLRICEEVKRYAQQNANCKMLLQTKYPNKKSSELTKQEAQELLKLFKEVM